MRHATMKNPDGSRVRCNCLALEKKLLFEELECKICHSDYLSRAKNRMERQLYQCQMGHVVCFSCFQEGTAARRKLVASCHYCRIQGPMQPNQALNSVQDLLLTAVPIPCRFASPGCAWEGLHRDLEEHVKVCPQRPATCIGCDHRTHVCDLLEHYRRCQNMKTVSKVEGFNTYDTLLVLNAFGEERGFIDSVHGISASVACKMTDIPKICGEKTRYQLSVRSQLHENSGGHRLEIALANSTSKRSFIMVPQTELGEVVLRKEDLPIIFESECVSQLSILFRILKEKKKA